MTRTLLIYAPVPLFRAAGQLYLEAQAAVGLRLWADNFEKVTVMMPVIDSEPPVGWERYEANSIARVRLHPLPAAYNPRKFMRVYRKARRDIGALIAEADVLSFAIGGLFGDWGAVAAFEARAQKRRFAVWTDRVESKVTKLTANEGPLKSRLRKRLSAGPMWALEKAVIRRADLGLFHGRDTFETYAPFSSNPHVVHDILLDRSYQISDSAFAEKQAETLRGPLKILYVGRADVMKGPFDWLDVLNGLRQKGVEFQAKWLGEGPALKRMQMQVNAAGLADHVQLPGFLEGRRAVMDALNDAHIFLFCHKTPESPRCLIEALMAGTPIVGYESAYARDLVDNVGGGAFAPLGDVDALIDKVMDLSQNRAALVEVQTAAFRCGRQYDQNSVFEHRSQLLLSELA